jgi:putative sigma-54 modulation protein
VSKTRHTPGSVDVLVKGKNVTITPALHDLVVRKMQRLDKYHDRLQQINVELSTESTRDADQHCHVEATTHVLGRTVRVATDHSEMYAAVDEAVDKLYRQLVRQKERLKAHHGPKPGETVPGELIESVAGDDEPVNGDRQPRTIIATETLDVKPMFEDEALDEMEVQGWGFFVFLNARNEEVNVLYRRDDGSYAIIEPRIR